jgi:hypothetical protein
MRIVTRQEWRARPPKSAPTTVPISARTAVCVHHDGATPVTVTTLPEACALMRRDQNYHMDHNGWADVGYNFLVASSPGRPCDGAILEGRGRDAIGAHCQGRNTPWIGVQVAIGGDQAPSPLALAAVRWLHDTFEAFAGHPLAMVGHSDGFPTECPGPILLAWVRAGMPAPTLPKPATRPTPPDPFQEEPVKDLVIACYRQLLGRPPKDEDEIAYWLVRAAQGAWTAKQLAAQMGDTKEAKDHAAGKK